MLFAVSHAVFAAFFILAAYLQLNDPDAALWASIYLIAAIFSILGCFNKLPRSLPMIFGSLVTIYAFAFMPAFPRQVDAHFFEQEEVREKGGLCLVSFQMFLLAASAAMSSDKSSMSALYLSAIVVAVLSAIGAYLLPHYFVSNNIPVAEHCKGSL